MGAIKLKRAYDPVAKGDGIRILVDRLWPRGLKKNEEIVQLWIKDAAPSTALRKWFSHDPEKWRQFQKDYFAELDKNPNAIAELIKYLRKGNVTLLYSSKDTEHNNAVALKQYLERKI